MRASIPALMILCLSAAHALSEIDWNLKPVYVVPLLGCLTFGSITAMHEIARSVLFSRWAPVHTRNLIEVSRGIPAHYIARMSPLLATLMRTPQPVPGPRLGTPASTASTESRK
jgi:hypothetical protein